MWKADASSKTTSVGLCLLALESISADNEGLFLRIGYVRDDSDGWTVPGSLMISVTPGPPTQAEPSTGEIKRFVGYPVSADKFFFNPDDSFVVMS